VVGGRLDYETRATYDLMLTASDGEETVEQAIAIDVTDVAEISRGTAADDVLRSGATADIQKGGAGNDRLIGGGGADRLSEGGGADAFVFNKVGHSLPDGFDVIIDFKGRQGDFIDLSGIDAMTGVTGNQAFDFIHKSAFSGMAGELRFETAGGRTLVEADVDGAADFAIQFLGNINFREAHFVL
jgi:serralysin